MPNSREAKSIFTNLRKWIASLTCVLTVSVSQTACNTEPIPRHNYYYLVPDIDENQVATRSCAAKFPLGLTNVDFMTINACMRTMNLVMNDDKFNTTEELTDAAVGQVKRYINEAHCRLVGYWITTSKIPAEVVSMNILFCPPQNFKMSN